MSKKEKMIHPYIPNSVPEVKAKMLEEIGAKDIEELYEDIPEHLRLRRDECQHENPEDTLYCGKCGGFLKSAEGISVTKTLITRSESLQKGSSIAGRYKIIEELGRGGWEQ